MQVAFGYIAGSGDLQQGLSAGRNATLLAGTIADDTLTVNATIIYVFGLALGGQYGAAQRAMDGIRDRVAAADPEYRVLRNLVRMDLALSQGDLAQAQALFDANQDVIDRFGLLFLYPLHVDLSGLLQIQQRRFDDVGRTARHLTGGLSRTDYRPGRTAGQDHPPAVAPHRSGHPGAACPQALRTPGRTGARTRRGAV